MKIELTPGQLEQLDRADELPVAGRYEQTPEFIEDEIEQRSLRRAGAKTLAKRLADESA